VAINYLSFLRTGVLSRIGRGWRQGETKWIYLEAYTLFNKQKRVIQKKHQNYSVLRQRGTETEGIYTQEQWQGHDLFIAGWVAQKSSLFKHTIEFDCKVLDCFSAYNKTEYICT